MTLCDDICAYQPFNEQEAVDKQVILRALRDDPNCFDRSAQAHMACSIWVVDPTYTQTLLVYHNIYDSWSWIGGHADGERDLAAVALRELEEETGVAHARLVECEMPTTIRALGAKAGEESDTGEVGKAHVKKSGEDAPPDKSAGEIASENTCSLHGVCSLRGVRGEHGKVHSPIFSLEVLTVDGHEKRGRYVSSHLHLNVTYLAVADPAEPIRIKPDENSGVKWVPLEDAVTLSTEPWIRNRIYRKLIDKLHILF